MAEREYIRGNLVWDQTATAQFYMNDSLVEMMIKICSCQREEKTVRADWSI